MAQTSARGPLCWSSASPVVVLDHHTGSPDDLNAPDWTRWTRRMHQFRQPRGQFCVMFGSLAFSEGNVNKVYMNAHYCCDLSNPDF